MSNSGIPAFSVEQARLVVRDLYGIDVEARRLASYRDQNFLLDHSSGRRLVLKIANSSLSRDVLELQNRAMEHAAAHGLGGIPRVCTTLDGEAIVAVPDADQHGADQDGASHLVRLLTFVPGTVWSELDSRSPSLGYRVGRYVGEVDRALADCAHPAMHRFDPWDLKNTSTLRQMLDEIPEPTRKQAAHVVGRFEQRVAPRWSALRSSVIHGDANNDNLLLDDSGTEIVGLIDFGDTVHTATVCEPAITMAYTMLGEGDPLTMGEQVLRGYHQICPLEAVDLDVLFDLVLARLAISLGFSFHYGKQDAGNTYLTINQEAVGRLLGELIDLDAGEIRERFARACGETVGAVRSTTRSV